MQEVQNPKLESSPNLNPIFNPSQPPPKKKTSLIVILAGLSLIFIALVVVGAYYFTILKSEKGAPLTTQKTEKEISLTPVQEASVLLKADYQNPFEESAQYVNPFSEYNNPFDLVE